MTTHEYCFKCGLDCITPQGVIYVRAINPATNKWDNMPICEPDWTRYYRSKSSRGSIRDEQ